MPCALTSDADYPDYLKSILKEINAGNDDELKVCACQLKSPADEGGCLILDEDGKIGLFPGCLVIEEAYGQSFTLKEIIKLYWMTKNITLKMDYIWKHTYGGPFYGSFSDTLSFVGEKNIQKVCPPADYRGDYGEITINPTPRKKEQENLYSLDINGDGRKLEPGDPLGGNNVVPVWMFSMGLNGSGFTWGFDETGPEPISATLSLKANFYDGTSLKLN